MTLRFGSHWVGVAILGVLLAAALAACQTAPPAPTPTPPPPTPTRAPAPAATPTPRPAAQPGAPTGDLFADMPIYAGARLIPGTQVTWAMPGAPGEVQRAEWRTYKTGASAAEVARFYQTEMPKRGWQQTLWFSAEGDTWGTFTKNDGRSWAWVLISSDQEEYDLALWRGEGP